jgi:predicted CXXCH cytochrome family protein
MRSCLLLLVAALSVACIAGSRNTRCDPFRTPRVLGRGPVADAKARSSHAPYTAGDCGACHLPHTAVPGESAEQAKLPGKALTPVLDQCLSCHREMFRAPPKGHPSERSFCTSCHDPHSSRERSLLLAEDPARACYDHAPPQREDIPNPPPRRAGYPPAGGRP